MFNFPESDVGPDTDGRGQYCFEIVMVDEVGDGAGPDHPCWEDGSEVALARLHQDSDSWEVAVRRFCLHLDGHTLRSGDGKFIAGDCYIDLYVRCPDGEVHKVRVSGRGVSGPTDTLERVYQVTRLEEDDDA